MEGLKQDFEEVNSVKSQIERLSQARSRIEALGDLNSEDPVQRRLFGDISVNSRNSEISRLLQEPRYSGRRHSESRHIAIEDLEEDSDIDI